VTGRVHADLQTAAHAIKDHHVQVEESLRQGLSNALTHAIEAGRKLAYAKSLVPHGGWGPWVEKNLVGIDARTERLYRQLAEAADADRLQSGNALPLSSIRQARELLVRSAAEGAGTASGAAIGGSESAGGRNSQAAGRRERMRWEVAARRLGEDTAELLACCRKWFGGPDFERAGRELYDALVGLYGDDRARELIDELSAVVGTAHAHAKKAMQVK
jgi:hypothetical protein